MADPHDTCGTCKFHKGSPVGACHRYPETIVKHVADHCGEYLPRPVYDIQTDAVVPVKRRGRPPKHD